jgi:hypothetical protein
MSAKRNDSFWQRFPGLVWSNSKADDAVMIRAALAKPKAAILREIAEEFGFVRLSREWKIISSDPLESFSATHRGLCNRILAEIEHKQLQHAV